MLNQRGVCGGAVGVIGIFMSICVIKGGYAVVQLV
jgi:hypothetical protein